MKWEQREPSSKQLLSLTRKCWKIKLKLEILRICNRVPRKRKKQLLDFSDQLSGKRFDNLIESNFE